MYSETSALGVKKLFIIPAILTASLLLASCTTTKTPDNSSDASVSQTQENAVSTQPERKVDVYGKITGIEGNEITLLQVDTSKDPTFNMTATEKKKYMQSLDESARMALKEQINSATLGETKLTVPVGIPMTKKTAQGPDAPNVEANLSDLKNGQYISVWMNAEITDKKLAEFVKIAFTQ